MKKIYITEVRGVRPRIVLSYSAPRVHHWRGEAEGFPGIFLNYYDDIPSGDAIPAMTSFVLQKGKTEVVELPEFLLHPKAWEVLPRGGWNDYHRYLSPPVVENDVLVDPGFVATISRPFKGESWEVKIWSWVEYFSCKCPDDESKGGRRILFIAESDAALRRLQEEGSGWYSDCEYLHRQLAAFA